MKKFFNVFVLIVLFVLLGVSAYSLIAISKLKENYKIIEVEEGISQEVVDKVMELFEEKINVGVYKTYRIDIDSKGQVSRIYLYYTISKVHAFEGENEDKYILKTFWYRFSGHRDMSNPEIIEDKRVSMDSSHEYMIDLEHNMFSEIK